MSLKTWVTIFVLIGGIVGGYVPSLWGDNSFFSVSSIIFSGIGGIVGIWVGYKIYQFFS